MSEKEILMKNIQELNDRLENANLSQVSILKTIDKSNVYILIHTRRLSKKRVNKIVKALKIFNGVRQYDEMLMIPNDANLVKTTEFVNMVIAH